MYLLWEKQMAKLNKEFEYFIKLIEKLRLQIQGPKYDWYKIDKRTK